MDDKIPQKTKELIWQKTGDIYVLADEKTKQSYTLDAISFLVWIQCDGKTSVNKITDVFAVSGNHDIVKAAIEGVLDKLVENGLIKWA